ncbi:MAG: cobalamin biosynthesis protein CobQ [Candidatus Roizmanbacteria bacterium]|nr:cobalamin biosynthesis protein CobQ [Candidatus Roizmanbacteria bacterium]
MKYKLQICWLYPDLMSTYGDRGNIIVLTKRCQWRGITVSVDYHTIGSPIAEIKRADLLFMGGAQDFQQDLVSADIMGKKEREIRKQIENDTPGLFICGAYQFLGRYYRAADGTKIPGLGIFDLYTEHTGDQEKRLVGNIVVRPEIAPDLSVEFVGFENHGGRTYLGSAIEPFARVIRGHGNNEIDNTEGALYKNAIGTYLHGPILPKNPELADWLIKKALEKKYRKPVDLVELDDTIERTARSAMMTRTA